MSFEVVLSEKAKRREPSAIRELAKLLQQDPSILSLGAGTPNAAAVPLSSISFEARVGGTCFESNPNKPEQIKLEADEQSLAVSYSPTPGILPLLKRLRRITIGEHRLSREQQSPERLSLMVGTGSQSLLAKGLDALCNPGDAVLVEEATYPGTLALLQGIGVRTVPVAADEDGMEPSALRKAIETWPEQAAAAWDSSAAGPAASTPKPRVLYLIPNGSNPTGISMSGSRRRALYKAAQEHDLFVVEDDPYYWLRYPAPGAGDLGAGRGPSGRAAATGAAGGGGGRGAGASTSEAAASTASVAADSPKTQLSGVSASGDLEGRLGGESPASGTGGGSPVVLSPPVGGPLSALPPFLPSFLHLDTDGRVLRLDSFSKIVAGGLRMGFACGPRAMLERMELDGQASDLHASGLSQAVLCATLRHWGAGDEKEAGTAWDDAVEEGPARSTSHLGRFEEHVRHVAGLYRQRCAVFLRLAVANLPSDKVKLAVPEAGMFFWIRTSLKDTRDFVKAAAERSKVLLLPGSVFAPKAADGEPRDSSFVRASFSRLSEKDTAEALRRLGECFQDFDGK